MGHKDMTSDDTAFSARVSAEVPDMSRETPARLWDPSRQLMRSLRRYQNAKGPFAPLIRRICVLQHRFWSVVTGADIPLRSQIGGGLLLPHPNGVVVHPDATIGVNCLLFQQVTLAGAVKMGGHVDVGAGAKILGPVVIGDHVKIGANAVVTQDIPSGHTAKGIPAVLKAH